MQHPNAEGQDLHLREENPLSNLDLKDQNGGGLSSVFLQHHTVKSICSNSHYRRKF